MKKYKVIEIICHILGFPLLLAILCGISAPMFKGGIGYGVPVFAGVIVTVVIAAVYYVVYFVLTAKEKKKREALQQRIASAERNGSVRPSIADPGRRMGIVLAIVAIVCLTGLWVLIDVALPAPIQTATSNTVLYEDLADNWQARGDVHVELLDEFITRAYKAGNLKQKTLAEYLKEGIKNKEVKDLIADEFESIDKNGYATFIGPSIDLAQNSRMTIPALVHLLLDERTPVSDENGQRLDKQIPLTTFTLRHLSYDSTDYEVGNNYQYIRSNGSYRYYTGNFEEAGESTDGLILFDSNRDYVKIQYLNAKSSETSFVYEIDFSSALKIVCVQYSYDRAEMISTIEQNGTEFKFKRIEGEVKTENSYATLAEACSDNAEFDLFANVPDVKGLTVSDVYGENAIAPSDWFPANHMVLEKSTELAYADWDVLDMLGNAMGFALPLDAIKGLNIDMGVISLTGEDLLTSGLPTINDALATVSALASAKEILGSQLTVGLNIETGELMLVPCNEARGTLDYMRVAWLQNNGLLYVLVGLFSTRKLYLIFGAVIAVLSYVIGVMHETIAKTKIVTQTETAQSVPEVKSEDIDLDGVNLDVEEIVDNKDGESTENSEISPFTLDS